MCRLVKQVEREIELCVILNGIYILWAKENQMILTNFNGVGSIILSYTPKREKKYINE